MSPTFLKIHSPRFLGLAIALVFSLAFGFLPTARADNLPRYYLHSSTACPHCRSVEGTLLTGGYTLLDNRGTIALSDLGSRFPTTITRDGLSVPVYHNTLPESLRSLTPGAGATPQFYQYNTQTGRYDLVGSGSGTGAGSVVQRMNALHQAQQAAVQQLQSPHPTPNVSQVHCIQRPSPQQIEDHVYARETPAHKIQYHNRVEGGQHYPPLPENKESPEKSIEHLKKEFLEEVNDERKKNNQPLANTVKFYGEDPECQGVPGHTNVAPEGQGGAPVQPQGSSSSGVCRQGVCPQSQPQGATQPTQGLPLSPLSSVRSGVCSGGTCGPGGGGGGLLDQLLPALLGQLLQGGLGGGGSQGGGGGTSGGRPPGDGVLCTQEYTPVCGIDGRTHGNRCIAERQVGVAVAYTGVCVTPGVQTTSTIEDAFQQIASSGIPETVLNQVIRIIVFLVVSFLQGELTVGQTVVGG